MKKAQGISMNMIVVAAILLIVLIVIIAIFMNGVGIFTPAVEGEPCAGQCKTNEACSTEKGTWAMGTCPAGQMCCKPLQQGQGK